MRGSPDPSSRRVSCFPVGLEPLCFVPARLPHRNPAAEETGIRIRQIIFRHSAKRQKNSSKKSIFELRLESGDDLVSRAVTSQVPSARRGLTSVFGMGTGGTLQPLSPEIGCNSTRQRRGIEKPSAKFIAGWHRNAHGKHAPSKIHVRARGAVKGVN